MLERFLLPCPEVGGFPPPPPLPSFPAAAAPFFSFFLFFLFSFSFFGFFGLGCSLPWQQELSCSKKQNTYKRKRMLTPYRYVKKP